MNRRNTESCVERNASSQTTESTSRRIRWRESDSVRSAAHRDETHAHPIATSRTPCDPYTSSRRSAPGSSCGPDSRETPPLSRTDPSDAPPALRAKPPPSPTRVGHIHEGDPLPPVEHVIHEIVVVAGPANHNVRQLFPAKRPRREDEEVLGVRLEQRAARAQSRDELVLLGDPRGERAVRVELDVDAAADDENRLLEREKMRVLWSSVRAAEFCPKEKRASGRRTKRRADRRCNTRSEECAHAPPVAASFL